MRTLLRAPWTSVEAQSGQLRHRSTVYPGALSVSSLLIRTAVDVLVCADVYEKAGREQFHLRFDNAADAWGSSYLRSARPPFAPVLQWPAIIVLPPELLNAGPEKAEVGLGHQTDIAGAANEQLISILWCCFSFGSSKLLIFADNEIPLNVGLAQAGNACSLIKRALSAVSVTKL